MGLVDIFRPKWKHSDPAVRAAAVRHLGPEDREPLAIIAREDDDPSVRRLALKKLSDAALLLDLARTDVDEGLRQLAEQRATSLLLAEALSDDPATATAALERLADQKALSQVAKSAPLEVARMDALARLTDARTLVEVARNAEHGPVRREAVQRLDDPVLLKGIALSEEGKDVGLAAVERLGHEPEALDAIAKRARHKGVRKRARELLEQSAVRPAAPRSAGLRKRQTALLKQVEALAGQLARRDWKQVADQIEEARRAMAELEAEAGATDGNDFDAEVATRFGQTCEALVARHRQQLAADEARTRRAEEVQDRLEARLASCEELEQLSPQEATTERLEQLEARWLAQPEVDNRAVVELQRRFERGIKRARAAHGDWSKGRETRSLIEALCDRAETLVRTARKIELAQQQWAELEKEWQRAPRGALDQSLVGELEERFARGREQLAQRAAQAEARRAERARENEQQLVALLDSLVALHRTDDLRLAERALKESGSAQKRIGRLPDRQRETELRDQLQQARQTLRGRIDELREAEDWKRWANVPQQEELCQAAEALTRVEDREQAAQQLRQLQQRWKQIGPVPREKSDELWQRFRTACDQVREHCAEYFATLEQERQRNLQQKEALCQQVEALAESTDWEETAARIKALQAEWKQIGPVSRQRSDAVWKRFRAACDAFFDRRKKLHLKQLEQQRKENLKLKQQLCEQVEALAGSTDWKETADRIKALQAEWKRIGPVPRKQSDALWKRFRGGCDAFFNAREAHFEDQRTEHLVAKEALCSELEAFAQRCRQAATRLEDPCGTQGSSRVVAQGIRATGTTAGEEPSEPDTVAGVEQPGAIDGEELARRVEQARQRFGQVPSGPRGKEEAVRERFQRACHALALARPEAFKGTDLDPLANQRRMELICKEAEALLPGVREPEPEADAHSVEEMASRLRDALADNVFKEAGSSDPVHEAVRTIKNLHDQLQRLGPVPVAAEQTLAARFRQAHDRVMSCAQRTRRG